MKVVSLLSALAIAAVSVAVSANVMAFDNLPPGESDGLGSYTEDGITAFGPDFWNLPAGTLHLDVGGVAANNNSYSFKLDSGLFNLDGFDVLGLGVPATAIGGLEGYDQAGVRRFATEFSIATSRTLSFTDWRRLSGLKIFATGDIDDHFSIDNLALSAVPEPGSWGLMVAGFALVGAAVRRHPGGREARSGRSNQNHVACNVVTGLQSARSSVS